MSKRNRIHPLGQEGFTLIQVMMISAFLMVTAVFLGETVRYVGRQSSNTRMAMTRDQLSFKIRALATDPVILNYSSNNAANGTLLACLDATAADCANASSGFEIHYQVWNAARVDRKATERNGVNPPGIYYTIDGEVCAAGLAASAEDTAILACPFMVHTRFQPTCVGGYPCATAEKIQVGWRVSVRALPFSSNRLGGSSLTPVDATEEIYTNFITGTWIAWLTPLIELPGHLFAQESFL